MKCPTCPDATLVLADRQGIEIDYCPQCRGIWLDRGELDKLIERAESPSIQRAPAQHPNPGFVDSDFRGMHGHRKKKSWLGEILD